MLRRGREVNVLRVVARILCEGIVWKITGLIMCGVVPPPSHMSL
jgi:hypothetical protein